MVVVCYRALCLLGEPFLVRQYQCRNFPLSSFSIPTVQKGNTTLSQSADYRVEQDLFTYLAKIKVGIEENGGVAKKGENYIVVDISFSEKAKQH